MKLKAIITGATGMVGEGVLHECLQHAGVEEVLIINRKPSGITHAKLKEIVHADFFNLAAIEDRLKGYNACFFCLGVSSIGMNEKEYTHITYDLTLNFAQTLSRQNSDMVFCFISGAATDSSERGRSMWARVKGRTENALLKMPFKQAYMFRPGYMHPTKGLKNTLVMYNVFGFLYPLFRLAFPKFVCTLRELALAMINSALKGYDKPVLEVKDIVKLAKG
jgi:uncharacterized protein YbjT (DUF2867 family)